MAAMAHIIVDGYNFIRRVPRFSRREGEGLQEMRYAMLLELEEYAAKTGYAVTVVFDGGSRPTHMSPDFPREERFAGIDVIYSDRGQSADTAILDLIRSLRDERRKGTSEQWDGEVVVTDDYGIRDEAIEEGAFVKSSEELFEAMEEGQRLSF